MKRAKRALLVLLLALLAAQVLWAWPWSRDMVLQIFIHPQQQVFLPPEGAIPVGWEPPLTRDQATRELHNPLAPTPENLQAGKLVFDTNCFPCHGSQGKGNGPVAGGTLQPANLTAARIQSQPDGQIYDTLRHGLGSMAPYYERLTPQERWEVILYVRTLGKSEGSK